MKKDIDKYIIAIDGYSSTGKSTYAKMLAKNLDGNILIPVPCTGR